MAASFPTSVKSFTTKVDNVDTIAAAHVNDIQDEVVAVETALGAGMASVMGAARNYIAGLTLSNNGADATNDIDIAAGECASNDAAAADRILIRLSSGLTKQLDAAWAVGTNAGMLATGAAVSNTTYHIFLIERPDTGVVDVAADSSNVGSNIAANTNVAYTKKRRIGSIVRSGDAILAFKQREKEFLWNAIALDLNASIVTADAVLRTVTVPSGIKVGGVFCAVFGGHPTEPNRMLFTSPDVSDQTPTVGITTIYQPSSGLFAAGQFNCRTSSAAQIRSRIASTGTTTVKLELGTIGWVDDLVD